MNKPSPDDFSLTQAQVNMFQKANIGLRYSLISSIGFFIFCTLIAILAKGWAGFFIGLLLSMIASFFLIVFGASLGEQIHALFFPRFERFLEYRKAIFKYKKNK